VEEKSDEGTRSTLGETASGEKGEVRGKTGPSLCNTKGGEDIYGKGKE